MSTLALDTETRGLEWFNPDHRAFLVSWADDTGSYVERTDDPAGVARFKAAVMAGTSIPRRLAIRRAAGSRLMVSIRRGRRRPRGDLRADG